MTASLPFVEPVEAAPRQHTACCIVGGGPAGMVLALILARQGISVTVLEAHTDFERDFRGDSVHALSLKLFDELGLIHRILQIPHTKLRTFSFPSGKREVTPVDFGRLHTPYPYIAMIPQSQLLACLADDLQQYDGAQVVLGASVVALIEEDGAVRGVRYRNGDTLHEVRAALTVGADGRFSRVRKLAGIELVKTAPPMDVLWFRLPRHATDPAQMTAHFGKGHMLVMFNRATHWQVALVIMKGSFQQLRASSIQTLQQLVAEVAPPLVDRVTTLTDWKQCAVLSVESGHVSRWYKPGVLLIGDAAHVMTPVAGVGINCAMQDAVATANILSEPLKQGQVTPRDLAAVQRRRAVPTRFIQAFQAFVQKQIIVQALRSKDEQTTPLLLRIVGRVPLLNTLSAYIVAFGIWPVHLSLRVRRAMQLPPAA